MIRPFDRLRTVTALLAGLAGLGLAACGGEPGQPRLPVATPDERRGVLDRAALLRVRHEPVRAVQHDRELRRQQVVRESPRARRHQLRLVARPELPVDVRIGSDRTRLRSRRARLRLPRGDVRMHRAGGPSSRAPRWWLLRRDVGLPDAAERLPDRAPAPRDGVLPRGADVRLRELHLRRRRDRSLRRRILVFRGERLPRARDAVARLESNARDSAALRNGARMRSIVTLAWYEERST